MLNKIFITLILLCGIASADFLDNSKSCEVRNNDTTVAIGCGITENSEQVRLATFKMKHDVSECEEHVKYEDGTLKRTAWFVYNNIGVVYSTLSDEYDVEIAKEAHKTKAARIKKICMERYTQYKAAKNKYTNKI